MSIGSSPTTEPPALAAASHEEAPTRETLLALDGMTVTFRTPAGDRLPLVREASFQVRSGEIVCLVGESGSGKSVTARTVMGLTQRDPAMAVGGRAEVLGHDIVSDPSVTAGLRGRDLAMVFQEPMSSLDPVCTVGTQLTEALRRRHGKASRQAERSRLAELLAEVGIVDGRRVLDTYPHQLSGGMCQRVMIAQALACAPRLLIADEPTTALDVTIQAQILELVDRLRTEEQMAVLLVTHDMAVAAELADRVVVMYAGRVVEDAAPVALFDQQLHPYTSGLLRCIPPMVDERPARLVTIPGGVPSPAALPTGCSFHPRCPHSVDLCADRVPELADHGGRRSACWRAEELSR
ncbi:ABC transporter ATP-binding protein [Auraticoccus cholistanensis]|uniref:ABC transporter ATP-binding protein n=1 Tax=Auraticoccus cholistanensis TaxID=2656650 RepID=UPI0018D26031|nr:ABC transporter ATP-binding protein [Auraticoccus cholistanensis]